jgi:dihydroxy-acid dehydratase
MAVAHEAGIEFSLERINAISERTPCLTSLRPGGKYHIEDLDAAGGIPAVMKELKDKLNLEVKTVSGRTVADIVSHAVVNDNDVIRTAENAYSSKVGWLCCLAISLRKEPLSNGLQSLRK